jgi:heme a synthase
MPVARFAWLVLFYNVAVINWGAYVRATGSGAGCGSHWPLCNGQVVPRDPALATIIEFSHRLTSGLALIGVVILAIWVFRACRPGHPARTAAVLSVILICTEAAVGAGLVVFQLVADNATMARAMFVAVHLLNTFFLLGALTLTAWWTQTGRPLATPRRGRVAGTVAAGCAALLIAGASGAVAALGDTLFPSTSFGAAILADLSATSHALIRLRVLHPFLAVCAAASIVTFSLRLSRRGGPNAARGARVVAGLALAQVGLGFLNVVLLAPVWLQMVHLLVADAIWIGFVALGADALCDPSVPARAVDRRAVRSAGDGSRLASTVDTVVR